MNLCHARWTDGWRTQQTSRILNCICAHILMQISLAIKNHFSFLALVNCWLIKIHLDHNPFANDLAGLGS